MNKLFIFLLVVCSFFYTYADSPITIQKELNWDNELVIHNPTGQFAKEILAFEGAIYNGLHPEVPYVLEVIPLTTFSDISVELVKAEYEPLRYVPEAARPHIKEQISFQSRIEDHRRALVGKVTFVPIRQVGPGRYEKLVRYELRVLPTPKLNPSPRGGNGGTLVSVLDDGSIWKIAVTEEGIHKLDYNFLKDQLKMDIDNIDPKKIKIYGNGGGALPDLNSVERQDDLAENAIQIVGEEDGSFDSGDYILFYAEGPDKWYFNSARLSFSQPKNPFDDRNYYFVKVNAEDGLRVSDQASLSATSHQTNTFDHYIRFEEDRVNILNEGTGTQGTGQRWYGESFNTTRERTKTFEIPNVLTDQEVQAKVVMAARGSSNSSFSISIGNTTVNSNSISRVQLGDSEAIHARTGTAEGLFNIDGDQVALTIAYPPRGDGTNVGWLDYIELSARRQLTYVGPQMKFQDTKTLVHNSTTFQMGNANDNVAIWDISDPLVPKRQLTQASGSSVSFGVNSEEIKQFIAFEGGASLLTPEAVGTVSNQNLHGIEELDMLIVYHPEFEEATQKLAEHRQNFSKLNVVTANIFEVYNEFSSGSQDPTAIRDMAALLYERSNNFRYLLLMGDGSFDYKNIYGLAKEGEEKNFIPIFETLESLDPILGFPSDDYFAMLSPNEGANLRGGLDIAVGRLTVRTPSEAMATVDKIIKYDSDPTSQRDWRNRITFVADDEDGNLHLRDADRIAVKVDTTYKDLNLNKIYLDAYQQESTPGGARYPQAQQALNRDMFRGALVVNYLGHGGSRGWAQERVLTIADILSWKNQSQLPLFITATCSFTGYDEPSITTAGEEALLNRDGGVIGLFTTVRAVYASSNFQLTRSVFDIIFEDPELPIGEILMRSKNSNSSDNSNARKFTLIGDPAMRLALPRYGVTTTEINGRDIQTGYVDTLRALQKVTIKGFVNGNSGQMLSDFNGKVYPTIFDKRIVVRTLGQDERSNPQDFDIQRNVIFKGVASVVNGQFEFSFVVPKDIDYNFGFGKISYYAENGQLMDARGSFENVIIGGADSNGFSDDQGPLVEVFMNNEDFIFGGQTDENPTLYVKLSDDNGINVAGNSIGHDLSAVLDNNTQNSYILNDFYQSELDDYTKGVVQFPLFDMAPGKHEIRVKAWDIANNSSEGYTEFVVADSESSALAHVLNYPNPFTTSTNFQFEYNQTNQPLDVQVQIYTVSGRLVKTLEDQLFNEGSVMRLPWDGRDDFGDRLAKGVYLYRVKVRTVGEEVPTKKIESEFEKLVILK